MGSTTGVTLTAHATPHTLSATRTEIIAATTYEAEWIEITVHEIHQAATLTDALLNIYIGAGGSEVLLIDSLSVGWAATVQAATSIRYWFPIRIPRGTRISATLRALIASETCELMVRLGTSNGAHWVGSGVETLGEDTANSRGTAVTPATSAPSWASIGTSGRRYKHISVGVQGNNDTTALGTHLRWSIGTGSAMLQGLGGIPTDISATEWHVVDSAGRWCDIPESTALQLRAWSSGSVSGLMYATLHGVY